MRPGKITVWGGMQTKCKKQSKGIPTLQAQQLLGDAALHYTDRAKRGEERVEFDLERLHQLLAEVLAAPHLITYRREPEVSFHPVVWEGLATV